jgi:hypothetical protein
LLPPAPAAYCTCRHPQLLPPVLSTMPTCPPTLTIVCLVCAPCVHGHGVCCMACVHGLSVSAAEHDRARSPASRLTPLHQLVIAKGGAVEVTGAGECAAHLLASPIINLEQVPANDRTSPPLAPPPRSPSLLLDHPL